MYSKDDRRQAALLHDVANGSGSRNTRYRPPSTLRDASNADFSRSESAFSALTIASSLSPSRRRKMTDDDERPRTADDEQPKKKWSNAPTPITRPQNPPHTTQPQRALLPLPSAQGAKPVQSAVPGWDRKNKAQKLNRGDDASSSSRRASAGGKGKKTSQEVIEIPDDDDHASGSTNRTAAILGVTVKSPFSRSGLSEQQASRGELHDDMIDLDAEDDAHGYRVSTPTRAPTMVKRLAQKYEDMMSKDTTSTNGNANAAPRVNGAKFPDVRPHDFTQPQRGVKNRMKPKTDSALQVDKTAMTAALMRGKDSADAVLYKRPPGAVDYNAPAPRTRQTRNSTSSTAAVAALFGNAPAATIIDDDEPSEAELAKREKRLKRFANDGKVQDPPASVSAPTPPKRKRAPSNTPSANGQPIASGSGSGSNTRSQPQGKASSSSTLPAAAQQPKIKIAHGPIPLSTFCLGYQRSPSPDDEDDGSIWLFVDDAGTLRVSFSPDPASLAEATEFHREDLVDVRITAPTGLKPHHGGGLIFAVRESERTRAYGSTAFEPGDGGPGGTVVLKLAPPGRDGGWTAAKRDKFLNAVMRWKGVKVDFVAPHVLDTFVDAAAPEAVARGQAELLERANAKKNSTPRTMSEYISSYGGKRASSTRTSEGADIRAYLKEAPKEKEVDTTSFYARTKAKVEDRERERDPLNCFEETNAVMKRQKEKREQAFRRGEEEKEKVALARRSTRTRSGRNQGQVQDVDVDDDDDEPIPVVPKEPVKNPEEIILVYPERGPGALNISRGDAARLEPGEFLNDTLIEFWLKYWLKQLTPELATGSRPTADDVHVFSSFFYKKLNQRSFEDGYASVRKWTNKVDIFKKKFVVVPINEHIHWYLAIIYQPEHVLRPPPPKVDSPRRDTRQRAHEEIRRVQERELEAASTPTETGDATPTERGDGTPIETRDATRDATPTDMGDAALTEMGDAAPTEDPDPMDVDEPDFDAQSTTASVSARLEHASLEDNGYQQGQDREQEVDELDPSLEEESEDDGPLATQVRMRSASVVAVPAPPPAPVPIPIPTRVRSRSVSVGSGEVPELLPRAQAQVQVQEEDEVEAVVNGTGTGTATSRDKTPTTVDNDVDDDEKEGGSGEVDRTTYIFTFDSLGSKHPQAIKNLRKYLAAEAKDKLGILETSEPVCKKVTVPTQPNYCDCGLYLLHFAQLFVEEAPRLLEAINGPSKKAAQDNRNELWRNDEVALKREFMANILHTLSELYKEAEEAKKKAQETAKEGGQEEEDDDEVICETPTPKKKLRGGRGNGAVK